MAKAGWTVVYQVGLPDLIASVRRSIDEQLIEAARTLVRLIAPGNPFWKTKQGLHLFREGWQLKYRVDPGAALVTVVSASAAPKSSWTGWTVRYYLGVKLSADVRAAVTELLTDAAETLADLVHPHSPFWNGDQQLSLEIAGTRYSYRVDQEALRIFVNGVEPNARKPESASG